MSHSVLDAIRDTVQQCHIASQNSGLVVSLAIGQGPIETLALGSDTCGTPLTPDSIFPLASITKLAVALALLRQADQGLLSLDDPLSRFAPEAAAAQPGVTLKRLLTHSAGTPVDFPPEWVYDENVTWQGRAQACLQVAPDTPPGTRVMYDNLGYGLLAVVLQRLAGKEYQQAVKELVIGPLGIDAFLGEETPRTPVYLDDPGDANASTPIALWNSPFWRSLGEPWGGMLATSSATISLLRAFTGYPEGFLQPETAAAAMIDQAGGLGGGFPWQQWPHCPWGLGPEIILDGMRHWMDPGMGGGMTGHGGYTGCCVMYDPATQVCWSIHGTTSSAKPWFSEVFGTIRSALLGAVKEQHAPKD